MYDKSERGHIAALDRLGITEATTAGLILHDMASIYSIFDSPDPTGAIARSNEAACRALVTLAKQGKDMFTQIIGSQVNFEIAADRQLEGTIKDARHRLHNVALNLEGYSDAARDNNYDQFALDCFQAFDEVKDVVAR